jgi:ATP-dependent Clp protease ATP-binding subunit ClpC
MAKEEFQLATVTRLLAEGVELSESPAFPEISALAENERQWRTALQAKTKELLESPAYCSPLLLYRRRASVELEIDAVTLSLEPPRRSPDWQEPVELHFPFVKWSENDEWHHAYVPTLGLQVFSTRPTQLVDKLKEHIRLVLVGSHKKLTLRDLAPFTTPFELKTGKMEVAVNRKSLRQLAAAITVKEGPSTLEKVAEELPPPIPRGKSADEEAPKQTAKANSLPPPQAAFEMEQELQNLAESLAGPHKRSVLLIGPAGCGKTALVHELARRRRDFGFGHTPFWSTRGARLMTGPIGFGMWQERCQDLIKEIAKTNSILHLGNLGELLEVGKTNRTEQSVGSFLRPAIARGEILTITECTPEQINVIERQEPHLLSAFQHLIIPERTPGQTRAILSSVFDSAPGKPTPQTAQTALALDRIHQLHTRYATYSANPARPIRFLKNLLSDRLPEKTITEPEVTTAFSRETGLPLMLLDDAIPLDLSNARNWFGTRVIGQSEAVDHVINLLALIKARLSRPRKPLASFLFIGPTGTGKTEMAKALAEYLFGSTNRMARFDLNEFGDPIAVQRLIGGPAIGSAEGLLTARVREQPFSVLLLDEFEKADPAFFDLLLQVLGDGRLTDAAGRVADFCNTVIVMTSNLGAQGFQRGPSGFRVDGATTLDAQEHFTDAVQKFLRPEIFNRLDSIVPFRPLTIDIVLSIAQRQLNLIRQRDGLRLRPLKLSIQPSIAAHLAERGYDLRYGARPLKRAIERELLTPLSEALNEYAENLPIIADLSVFEGRIKVQVHAENVPDKTAGIVSSQGASGELAQSLVTERRLSARLKNCSAASALENQVTMLESLERRLKTMKWKSPEHQTRLARLPKLRECLTEIATLMDKSCQVESNALLSFYQREELKHSVYAPEIHALQMERKRLTRELFRLQQENPNDIVISFFSENQPTLLFFAAAYFRIASSMGEVLALDYFTPPAGGRSSASRPVRETPKDLEKFWSKPPEKLLGLIMHLRGDLFFPRFKDDTGFHTLKVKNSERVCLVMASDQPFVDFNPPEGIDRPGTIKAQNVSNCRTFDSEKKAAKDAMLGECPWLEPTPDRCLTQLLEDRLNKAIESITN